MRLPHSPRRRSLGLSMTPLIDMSFLLITFFIMTLRLSMSAAEQRVELPRADQAKATHERSLAVVTLAVDRDGRVYQGDAELALDDLVPLLHERAAGGRTVKLVLRADARAPFRAVRAVMGTAAGAGIERLSIAALKLSDGAQ